MSDVLATLFDLSSTRFNKPREELTPESDLFQALAIDSFQAMELLTEIEEKFGIEVPDYEIQDIRTFQALAEVIQRRL